MTRGASQQRVRRPVVGVCHWCRSRMSFESAARSSQAWAAMCFEFFRGCVSRENFGGVPWPNSLPIRPRPAPFGSAVSEKSEVLRISSGLGWNCQRSRRRKGLAPAHRAGVDSRKKRRLETSGCSSVGHRWTTSVAAQPLAVALGVEQVAGRGQTLDAGAGQRHLE